MTKEEIDKRNIAIAEFMGYTIKWNGDTSSTGKGGAYPIYKINGTSTTLVFYHSSWDWLIPVLLKIGYFTLEKGYCSINTPNSYYVEYEKEETIQAAFFAVSSYCLNTKK